MNSIVSYALNVKRVGCRRGLKNPHFLASCGAKDPR